MLLAGRKPKLEVSSSLYTRGLHMYNGTYQEGKFQYHGHMDTSMDMPEGPVQFRKVVWTRRIHQGTVWG
jgi:hypothetical protein